MREKKGLVFNVGTSSQQIDGSLALLREVTKTNDVKQVYLEVYYEISQMPAFEDRTDMVSTYIISDYIKWHLHHLLSRCFSFIAFTADFAPSSTVSRTISI